MDSTTAENSNVRFQVDENPPLPITAGLGLQLAILSIAGIVLTPAIVIRAGGGSEAFLNWAVFAAVLISAITTIIQARKIGRIGAGYMLLMGTSGAFIAVCIATLAQAGAAMMCTLIIVSSIFQFVMAAKLSWLRRILTPPVAGTVIMLIAVTVMPIVFDMFDDVPETTQITDAAVVAIVTAFTIIAIALKSRGVLRLWAPVIGVIVGAILSMFYGIYDFEKIAQAKWIGLPHVAWPGFDLNFGHQFWVLLPTFILVTLVGAIETIGDAIAIQKVSWRKPRAIDFRAVQGALNADGLGNLLSGLVGTVPNTTYSSSVSITELTGVATRNIGIAIGVFFLVFAFVPKFLAAILAIPGPVVASYIAIIIGLLFVVGMKIIIQDGVSYRKALVVGISFWVGVGFQSNQIFPQIVEGFAGGVFQNGMTAGGLTAIILMIFLELTDSRRKRIELELDAQQLPKIQKAVEKFAKQNNWTQVMITRLTLVAEETLLSLIEEVDAKQSHRVQFVIKKSDTGAELEFVTTAGEENLQDQMALLTEDDTTRFAERELSLRMLKHLASSVRHQQYHNTHIVTVNVTSL